MPEVAEVSRRLAVYLGTRPEGLRILASGWETDVYEFALAGRSARLEASPHQPLVLRCYQGPHAREKGSRENRTMRALAAARFPVPRPYLFDPDPDPIGAPFLVMARAEGGPLFAAQSFPRAFKVFSLGFPGFVRAQAQLHRIKGGVDDGIARAFLPAATGTDAGLLDRLLGVIADRVEHGPLPGLRDALDRLRASAERFRAAPDATVHMDYHPQNVMVRGPRVTGVIDWVSADRGDRHLCAATTSVILASSAMDKPRWMRDNLAGNSLRALFAALYLPLYQALAPMEWQRLRYCQAVAALLRLSTFGMMRTRGPEAVGFRPAAIANVTPAVVRILSRYAARKTGIPVSIEAALPG